MLTLRLQDGLGFTALAAGLAFLPYASGFALCGLAVPRLPDRAGAVLPVVSPLVTRLTGIVPVASAAALSALVSTGTLLAAVLGVTVIGGLHLALPHTPLAPAALTAALLLSGAHAARRATRPTLVRSADREVVAPTSRA